MLSIPVLLLTCSRDGTINFEMIVSLETYVQQDTERNGYVCANEYIYVCVHMYIHIYIYGRVE